MRQPFLVPPQTFPVSKHFITFSTFKLAIGKTFVFVNCLFMAFKRNRIVKHHATHLATATHIEVQAMVPISRRWMGEDLATNPTCIWLEAFMDVLVSL